MPTLKRFRPDRSFDAFVVGQEVELDVDDETAQRYIRTGYLDELPELEPVDEPVDTVDNTAALAAAGFSVPAFVDTSDYLEPVAEAVTTTDEGVTDGAVEGTAGAGPVARSRRRQ